MYNTMYGRTYRSKTSAGKKRKQYRKRATGNRKRSTMRKSTYRKNTSVVSSAEKKYIEHGFTTQSFAQTNNSSTTNGYYLQSITPLPAQGLGQTARVGQKIFVTGSIMDCQIISQSAVTNAIKYKWYLVRIPDAWNASVLDIVPSMFDPNPRNTGIYDWHSNLDPEKSGQFKIIAKGQGTLKPDSLATQTGITQFRKYLKLGFPIKWDSNTLLDEPTSNQWRVILFADSGRNSDNTGMFASMNFRTFYLDN